MANYKFTPNNNGTVKVTKTMDGRKAELGSSATFNQALIEVADDFEPGTVVDLSRFKELVNWSDSEYLYACHLRHIATWVPTYGIMGNN
jgi:hypothetical protein